MLPVLHQVNVSLINDKQFDRRQEVKISLLLSFSTNDGPQAQRGGDEDVRGVEGGVKSDAPLQNRHSYTWNSQGHVSSLITTKPPASTFSKCRLPLYLPASPLGYNWTQTAFIIKSSPLLALMVPSSPSLFFTGKSSQKIVSPLKSPLHSSTHCSLPLILRTPLTWPLLRSPKALGYQRNGSSVFLVINA